MITVTDILECEKHLRHTEAVIFDMDDTLYPEKAYVRSGYAAVAAVFPKVDSMEEKLWSAFLQKQPAIDVVLEAEGMASAENKQLAVQTYRTHTPVIGLYPDACELLEKLKGHKKLGLITDGRPEGQWAKIKALDIEKYFEKIIVTDELGDISFRKPNDAAFRLMQQALDVPFEKMVYIGDNINKDFIAPEKLKMQAIYFKNQDGLYTG